MDDVSEFERSPDARAEEKDDNDDDQRRRSDRKRRLSSGDEDEFDFKKRESTSKAPKRTVHGRDGRDLDGNSNGHLQPEQIDTDTNARDTDYVDKHDSKSVKIYGQARDRKLDSVYESEEAKGRVVNSSSEKDARPAGREERSKGKSRTDFRNENDRKVTTMSESGSDPDDKDSQRRARERSDGLVEEDMGKNDNRYNTESHVVHRQQVNTAAHGIRDDVRDPERSVSRDEDGHGRMRDRSGKELGHSRRSQSPERSRRHHRELDDRDRGFPEFDNRSSSLKGKEQDEGYRDDRSSKGKDSNWIEHNRERGGSKDQWKKTQDRKDVKDGDSDFNHIKEWDSMRCEQERVDSEKFHSWAGYRKDTRLRQEGGSQNVTSDRIEIIPNRSLDFGRQDTFSTFSVRSEVEPQHDFARGVNGEKWEDPSEEKDKASYGYGDDLQERYKDDNLSMEQNPRRNYVDAQRVSDQKGHRECTRSGAGQSPSNSSQSSFGNNQVSGSFNMSLQQEPKGSRPGRGGRGGRLTGRDIQRLGVPVPMMGPPFGHPGLSPGPMQLITPNMSHSPIPQIGPGILMPPFQGPLVWPGARGVEMNILALPPGLPLIPPPGPAGTRFSPNMGAGPNPGMYFNQPGPGRGAPPGSNFHGPPHDKAPSGWGAPKNIGPAGRAPSRGEQNDYSQNFVDTGLRPQNFIRELELTNVVEDYPKLRELIQKKDEIVANSASPPMYHKCDLREHVLSPEFFGTKFDVILVDPPWEEYVHRAPGVTDNMEYWTFEEIQNLKIEAIADTPSFIFLWVGDGVGLEQGRQCLKKWGFRRCEDICWVKTNKMNATPGLRHDSHTLFQHSKEHCLMGIKGTVRRNIDGHIIHANIDTDVVIAEEPEYGSTKKPEDMYRIIEHFSLGKRRLELFGEDHNIRSGWLTLGKELSSSNFIAESYTRNFADQDGKVWQGGGGRNPPPDAPHLVVTTPDIEGLRPKSPPPKNQQQQSTPFPSAGNSNSRRPMGNSSSLPNLNQDISVSDSSSVVPWGASSMRVMRGPEVGNGCPDDKFFNGFNICAQSRDHAEFESHQAVNLL